jgi:hypothetical protein
VSGDALALGAADEATVAAEPAGRADAEAGPLAADFAADGSPWLFGGSLVLLSQATISVSAHADRSDRAELMARWDNTTSPIYKARGRARVLPTCVGTRKGTWLVLVLASGCNSWAGTRLALVDVDGRPGLECAPPLAYEPEIGCREAGAYYNLELRHEDRMSDALVLEGSSYYVDGSAFARFDAPPDDIADFKDIAVGRTQVHRGPHDLSVLFNYRGRGNGVFAYMKGYRFEVRSSHRFFIDSGSMMRLVVQAHERGDPTTALEERPAVTFRVE